MSISIKKNSIALAAALICSTMVVSTAQADDAKGKCHGVNTCKGQTACATAQGSCAGTNSCKGTGWLPMTEKDCDAKGGKFESLSK